jgi:uncharacterized protein (TIGR02466 family)
MRIEPIFSSFLASTHLHNVDNDALIKYTYSLKEKSNGVKKSNCVGWQSEPFEEQPAELDKLSTEIITQIDIVKNSILPAPNASSASISNMWFNINPFGAFNRPHIHPNASFSGVYYVSTPDPISNIAFQHPGTHVQYHFMPDAINGFNEFTSAVWRYGPVAGDLLIFPAYLSHFVESNMSPNDRISIAFNVTLKLNDE